MDTDPTPDVAAQGRRIGLRKLARMVHRNRFLAAGALTVVALAYRRRLRRYQIAELSMAPKLQPGDYVVAVRSDRLPLRGDIVVVAHPDRPDFELVKRVIGLPGEHLAIRGGRVHIDGTPLAESWADAPTTPDLSRRLGQDVFVLGDRRTDSSADSRTIGPVPLSEASWRIVYRYWPRRRIGWI